MTRREKTETRREQIVEVALALLAETPLEQLTTRQIASALGISQPALFRHFRSREQIMLAVVAHVRAQLAAVAQRVLEADADPVEQLARLARALLAHVAEHPGLPRMLFSPPGRGAVHDALAALVSSQAALVAELVREGQRRGQMARELDAARAARSFVGMIQGAVLHAQLFDRQAALEAEAAPLVTLWLRGTAAREQADAERAPPCRAPADSESADGDAEPRPPSTARPEAPQRQPLGAFDVAPTIAAGHDPLEQILARLEPLEVGDVLALSVPFRPAPLITLLRKRGYGVDERALDDGRYAVDVVAGGVGGAPSIEDLVDLEPPEPLERVLRAASELSPGAVYLARLPRFPRLLLPHLRQRGLTFDLHEYADGLALLRIAAAKDSA